MYDTGKWAYNAQMVTNRLKDTAKSSALIFGLADIPADVVSMRQQLMDMQHKQKVDALLAAYEENVGPVASEQQKNMEALTLNKSKKFGEFQDEHIDEIKQGRDALKNIGIQFFAIPSDVNAEKVAVFKKDLKNGNLDLSIRKQKQNEHIAGTKERKTRTDREAEKGKFSTYFYEDTDVEKLISGLFGTGDVQYDSAKSLYPVEFISLEEPVGMAYNYGTGEYVEVKRIAIQYGGKGVHAYPVKDW